MGVCREQNNKQEQETQSAYQLSLHLLPLPLVEQAEIFLTGYNCCSALIYHTKELNVDTSKYFHTHGSPGAYVFSLFKRERSYPSLVVCDGNRNHGEYFFLSVCVGKSLCDIHEIMTRICVNVSEICTRLLRRED